MLETERRRTLFYYLTLKRNPKKSPGSGMMKRLLAVVARVPKGKVTTYGAVAYAAGFLGAARQVAWALHSSSGLPWHRIVGAGGQIKLPGEAGFEQRMRLQAEGVTFVGLRVDMKRHEHQFFRPKKREP